MHYSQAEVSTALQLFGALRFNEMPADTMLAIIQNDKVAREVVTLANKAVAELHLLVFEDAAIQTLELSTRLENLLLQHHVWSIGVLALHSEAEILRWRNTGPYTVRDLKELLKPYGLTLRPEDQTIEERVNLYATRSMLVQDFMA